MTTKTKVQVIRDKRTGSWHVYIGLNYRYHHKKGIGVDGKTFDDIREQFPKYLRPKIAVIRNLVKTRKPAYNTTFEKRWYWEFDDAQLMR